MSTRAICGPRACNIESRYYWDNWYHVGGHRTRSDARDSGSSKSEQDMFDCVAWLYDGFKLADKKREAA